MAAEPGVERTLDRAVGQTLAKADHTLLFVDHSSSGDQRFVTRGPGFTAVFEPTGMTLGLRTEVAGEPSTSLDNPRSEIPEKNFAYRWLREELLDVQVGAHLEAGADSGARANYFLGSDPSAWRTNLPMVTEIRYVGVYDRIDLRSYDGGGHLERDFIVYPGGKVESIALRYTDAKSVSLSPAGELLVETPEGIVRQSAPVVYQERGGERLAVEGHYVLGSDDRVGFEVAAYQADLSLIIDPTIEYATYLGGANADAANHVAVDTLGNFYAVGRTDNPSVASFPMAKPNGNVNGTIQNNAPGGTDAFVTKYSPAGTVVYSAIIGGNNTDSGQSIDVGKDGSAYICGFTSSSNFPKVKSIQNDQGGTDGFVTKLSPDGLKLDFSTYVGGDQYDDCWGLRLDHQEDIIITGLTFSDQNSFDPKGPTIDLTYNGNGDAYLAEIRVNDNSQPVPTPFFRFKTYLGSPQEDVGNSVAVGGNDDMYVVGNTLANSKFENVPNPQVQTQPGGNRDAFALQVNEGGNGMRWFTFLGGSQDDVGHGVKVTMQDEAVFGGTTDSSNFPTSGTAFQPNVGGGRDAFVAKINQAGNAKVCASYLGGSMIDQTIESGNSIALTDKDEVILVGRTNSANLQIKDGIQKSLGGATDAFVGVMSPDCKNTVFVDFVGGQEDDEARGVSFMGGRTYVVGQTSSSGNATGFPVTPNAAQLSAPGTPNGFVAVFMLEDAPPTTSFSGKVTDKDSGSNIAAASVSWGRTSATTGADGTYTFTNQACGTDTFSVSKTGYQTFSESYTPPCGGTDTKNVQLTKSGSVPHPADTNSDFKISGGEATAYGAAFVKGTAWPTPPSPPDVGHTSNAGLIFQKGKDAGYTDDGGAAPGRWKPIP